MITLSNAQLHTPSQGFDAGQDLLRGGRIDRIVWKNEDGARQMVLDRIDLDPGVFLHSLRYSPYQTYDLLTAQESLFVSRSDAEEGSDIATGPGEDLVRVARGGSYIKDRGGADTYRGNADAHDAVSHDFWEQGPRIPSSGIDANLKRGRVEGPDGETDRLISIEEMRGTILDDVFRGDGQANIFHGLRGNDLLVGRGGFDLASYQRGEADGGGGIIANLARGTVRDGFGTTDQLKSIEGILGSKGDDVMRDNRGDNYFDGDDRIFMKVGEDWARGGSGADTFIFLSRRFGHDKIGDFDPDEGDRIDIRVAASMNDLNVFTDENGTGIALDDDNDVFL
ncbi:hypothetical protein [Limimaricola cinnabarinus]|uniref:hypothetical protein n=1 Tax=Limimaricola cinnabarinus TaxID=1125964 RepID=UPI00249328EB|nr:hypothetical protein [Limimaricola cinnabarinus]